MNNYLHFTFVSDDYQVQNCPLLIIFLLLKHLGFIKELWWLDETKNPILAVSPRLIAVIIFNFSALANLYLNDPEDLQEFLEKKGNEYNFSFIKRRYLSENKYLELEQVKFIIYCN
jgi:hypothetical protein